MTIISEHISLLEAIKSQQAIRMGINNFPTEAIIDNMKLVALNCFEPIRAHFNKPIGISSFYRNEALNKALGGSKTSQHCFGMAIDMDGDMYGNVENGDIFEWAKNNLEYDQIIKEGVSADGTGGWVHISYNCKKNRKQALIATFVKGKAVYTNA